MSAREKLYEAMAGGWSLTHPEAASLYRIVDDVLRVHAHELAEEQRAFVKSEGVPTGDDPYVVGVRDVIDLIDPHVGAGPVRPDEKPTT